MHSLGMPAVKTWGGLFGVVCAALMAALMAPDWLAFAAQLSGIARRQHQEFTMHERAALRDAVWPQAKRPVLNWPVLRKRQR
jgi:hypothetical protein